MRQKLHALANGKVQGVGYRWFVRKIALSFGLRGWVKNLPDTTVEVIAEGNSKDLEKFIEAIKIGPPGAQVQNLSVKIEPLNESYNSAFQDFEILR